MGHRFGPPNRPIAKRRPGRPAGRNAPTRNRATKSAELQGELATGTLRNAPERSGTLRPDLGPQIGRIASGIGDRNAPERSGTLRNAPERSGTLRVAPAGFGAPNRPAGRPARPLCGPKLGHGIGRIASGIGDRALRNALERLGAPRPDLEPQID